VSEHGHLDEVGVVVGASRPRGCEWLHQPVPLQSSELAGRSVRRKIRSLVLHIASDEDLLQLKRIAHADRASASDAQDIAFLEARRSRP